MKTEQKERITKEGTPPPPKKKKTGKNEKRNN